MNRRERKKEKTKGSIVNSAIEYFKLKGFHETSMEEIAEKSDVSKGTLYNYFRDKESILVAYFQLLISNHSEQINESFIQNNDMKSRLNELLDFINHIFHNDIELASIYFRYRVQTLFNSNIIENTQRSGIESLVLEIMKEAQANNEIRCDIPLAIISRNFMFLYINFFVSSIYGKELFEIDILKNQLIDLFVNGARL
ncbi:TetR/AcrR family transcriptional regulator [Clostridium estertheticum]|uniref:TetR/AcrR family transcriptional regulator n=1 Tax=Clostridium estertheticum TaxID=238834 RepID=A0A7Y3SUG6_9CLOT|nr:TetR/AcrR family transcriptional regulator [Clostridium estertheticum]NNU75153.1 TetR/AcrR family transcriptional regulator [Clostridium estertheticum]WBL48374.1 TetR/AcrR family transcriptional regulator [Clostridium estertheticum]